MNKKQCKTCPTAEVCIQSVTHLPCPVEGAKDKTIKSANHNKNKTKK